MPYIQYTFSHDVTDIISECAQCLSLGAAASSSGAAVTSRGAVNSSRLLPRPEELLRHPEELLPRPVELPPRPVELPPRPPEELLLGRPEELSPLASNVRDGLSPLKLTCTYYSLLY